jgi:hypothetical protein
MVSGETIAFLRKTALCIDGSGLLCYNLGTNEPKEAFFMENKPNKMPCSVALLAHV